MDPIKQTVFGFSIVAVAAIVGYIIKREKTGQTIRRIRYLLIGFVSIIGLYGGYTAIEGIKRIREQQLISKAKDIPAKKGTFQIIVEQLELQLAKEDTKIARSAVIKDIETEEYKKVPLLLERNIGVHTIKIAVESLDSEQAATVEDIDSVISKYSALGIHNVILVAKSGFTSAAHKRASAKAADIQLLSFEEALDADWVKVVDNLKRMVVSFFLIPHLTKVTVVLPPESKLPQDGINFGECDLINPDGENITTLRGYIEKILNKPSSIEKINRSIEDGKWILESTIPFLKGCVLRTTNSEEIPIKAVTFEAKCRKESKIISLDRASYGDAQVSFGSADIMGNKILFTISEEKSEPAQVGVSIRKIKQDEK